MRTLDASYLFAHARARPHPLALALAALCLTSLACRRDHASPPTPPQDAHRQSARQASLIPGDADVYVQAKQAALLELSSTHFMTALERDALAALHASPLAMCKASAQALGASLCAHTLHDALELDTQGAVHIARARGHWIAIFEATSPLEERARRDALRAASLDLTVATTSPHVELIKARASSRHQADDQGVALIRRPGQRLIVFPTTPHARDQDVAMFASSLLSLKAHETWRGDATRRALQDALKGELAIILRSEALAPGQKENTSPSDFQLRMLFSQVDHVALSLSRSSVDKKRVQGELLLSPSGQEPVFLSALDPARAPLEDNLGVLLSERAAGVFHLAVDPESLVEMLKSGLGQRDRQQLELLQSAYEEELLLNVQDDVLGNLTGQFVLVLYDREPAKEDEDRAPGDLLGALGDTREALYMQLEDSFAMERVLNAVTQISRHKLRRQRVKDIIQYVWLDDGELKGALLLGKDALVWVDSSEAVEQGMRQLNSPRSLHATQRARFGSLVGATQGFGLFIAPGALHKEEQAKGAPTSALGYIEDFTLISYEVPSGDGAMAPLAPPFESGSFSFQLGPLESARSPLLLEP